METIINGGVYRVNFQGRSPQFTGTHPAIVLRTLKEKELYLTIPLTSYTKERWEKTKRSGFGVRIIETNSIAKIEKFITVHQDNICNRWINSSNGNILILKPEVIEKINRKFDEYIKLTSQKVDKEYQKYYDKYIYVKEFFQKFCDNDDDSENIFSLDNETSDLKIIRCNKVDLHELSIADLKDIINTYISEEPKITFKNNNISIEIPKSILN